MSVLFTNNAATVLASGISNSATSLTVASGTGIQFPSPTGVDYFLVTLQSISTGQSEIVKVTSKSTDTFTIVRAQESTIAIAFLTNDYVQLRITAGEMTSLVNGSAKGGDSDQVFYENGQTVTANYTITSGKNAHSVGPLTIATGVTVTVPTGSRYVIL